MVKVGDKVRFLNSVGGGTVVKINKDIAYVEEEDGFETPVLIHECVVIESVKDKNSSPVTKETKVSQNSSKIQLDDTSENDDDNKLSIIETKEGDRINLVLAFLPENAKNLQNGKFDTYLVNDSNYYIFFTYLNKTESGWNTRYSGIVEPNIQIHIEEFGKEDLNDLERICIQYVAFKKDKPFQLKNTAPVEHKLDTVKFYKLHSFRENDYFDENALILNIVKNDIPERRFELSAAEIEAAIKSKKAIDTHQKQAVNKKHHRNNEPVEVDLHIHELLDSTTGMSNSDILNYQLDKFREVLENYKNTKGQKIVFIHGKGDGVLRKAILTELKNKYKHYDYQDASFREYGYGATQVTIK